MVTHKLIQIKKCSQIRKCVSLPFSISLAMLGAEHIIRTIAIEGQQRATYCSVHHCLPAKIGVPSITNTSSTRYFAAKEAYATAFWSNEVYTISVAVVALDPEMRAAA